MRAFLIQIFPTLASLFGDEIVFALAETRGLRLAHVKG